MTNRARFLMASVFLLGPTLAQPAPSLADTVGIHPTVMASAQFSARAGETVTIRCVEPETATSRSVLLEGSLTSTDGRTTEHFWSLVTRGETYGVGIQASGITHRRLTLDGFGAAEREMTAFRVVREPAVVRVVWAAWNGSTDCEVTRDQDRIPTQVEPVERGVLLRASDFTSGYAVDYAIPRWHSAIPRGDSVGLALEYGWDAAGYQFAGVIPSSGSVEVRRPDGKTYSETGNRPWVTVAEASTGRWQYSIKAGTGSGNKPIMWLLEVGL